MQAAVPPELNKLGADLEHAVAGLSDALEELREMARGIHPAILAHGGLTPALKALARRSSIPVDLELRIDRRLPVQVEVSAYYVVAEALTNATRHAYASAVTITVEATDNVLRICVQDDGRGGADFGRGAGLVGLKDRVEALSGRILLDSPHGAGTTLRAELPLTDPSPETRQRRTLTRQPTGDPGQADKKSGHKTRDHRAPHAWPSYPATSRSTAAVLTRARNSTRYVPVAPALCELLDRHIAEYPAGANGRLFVTRRGPWGSFRPTAGQPVTNNAYGTAWRKAREKVLTPAQQRSPMARRPYDLRHAAVSLWLNAGTGASSCRVGRAQRSRSDEGVRQVHRRGTGGGQAPHRGGAQGRNRDREPKRILTANFATYLPRPVRSTGPE